MEKRPGGWGVMADDILAGIYGAAVMLIIAFVMNIS
jgi:phosphatidylglycerophosphatase A